LKVFLLGETQADVVAVASRALAVLGDSSTEAGDTAVLHAEMTIRTLA